MPISAARVGLEAARQCGGGEPFAGCNLKRFRALGPLSIWLDRTGWTVILLLLFLVLFFFPPSLLVDAELSAPWQLTLSVECQRTGLFLPATARASERGREDLNALKRGAWRVPTFPPPCPLLLALLLRSSRAHVLFPECERRGI